MGPPRGELTKNTMELLRSWIKHPDTTDAERFGLINILVSALETPPGETPARALTAGNSDQCADTSERVELTEKTKALLRSWIEHPDTTPEERFGLIQIEVIVSGKPPADSPTRVASV